MPRPLLALLAAILVAFGVSYFSDRIDPYYLDVMTGVGINIILAVSLNLVNGYTGQFSLGHAGFMSVGAYLSAAITLLLGPRLLGGAGGSALQQGLLFLGALIVGGLGAALAGLAVGIPSLRLKGDYLALVTLGFGEIIRVIFQNVEALGGALGLNGIPNYTTVFWVYSFAALTVLHGRMPRPLDLWARVHRDPRRRDRIGGGRSQHDAVQDRRLCGGRLLRGGRRRPLRALQADDHPDWL
jgi:branched-chain amino acid transport system permease protein